MDDCGYDALIYSGVVPILPYIVQEQLQLGPEYTGYLVGAFAASLLIATPIFGVVSDRAKDRKWPIVVSLAALAAASLLFLLCTNFWHYLLVRLIQGFAAAGNWTVGLALVADVFPANQLGASMGIVMSGLSAGNLLGPSLGGTLFDHLGQRTPYYLFAAVTIAVLLFRLFVDERPAMSAKKQAQRRRESESTLAVSCTDAKEERDSLVTGPKDDANPSILALLREPAIWVNCVAVVAMSSINIGLEPVLPPYLTERFETTVAENGYLFLPIGVPNIFLGPIVGYLCDRYSSHLIMIAGLALVAISVPLITLPTTLVLPDMGSVVERKYPGASGIVYGLFNVSFAVALFIGPIISSQLYSVGGLLLPTGIFSGIAIAIMVLYCWYYWRYCRVPAAAGVHAPHAEDTYAHLR
ncbi:hypothetical protein GGF31_006935 [Allomyces arbusculus]|nr:hypothetical protein GGF31_006935 [Allomyces arbusculus]